MNIILGNNFLPIFVVTTFVAVVLLFEGLYMLWNSYRGPDARKIEQRLRTISASSDSSVQSAVLKNRMLSEVPSMHRMLLSVPRVHNLDRFILQSGLEWTVSILFLISMMLGVVGYVAVDFYWQFISPAFRWMIAVALAFLPLLFVQWRRYRRLGKIEQQLPDALDLISRSLRAGHSLASGLKMVSEEMVDPIAVEFGMTHDEINFGISLQQALSNLGHRIPITDLRYFIVAVLVQREAGGNLAEVLGNLSNLVRHRLQLQDRIKVLTAEGRISAWILALLPFCLAALLNWGNPEFIRVLWTEPSGIQLTEVTLFVMVVGALWLWRLTKFRL